MSAGDAVRNGRSRAGVNGLAETMLVWNGVVARVPGLAVRPTSVDELAEAVRFARDHGLMLSIKGANGTGGTSIAERAVTLDLSGLREITADPDACHDEARRP